MVLKIKQNDITWDKIKKETDGFLFTSLASQNNPLTCSARKHYSHADQSMKWLRIEDK